MMAMATGEEKKETGFPEEEEEKWIMHYSSNHQILLVGEGDFSFSFALAQKFGSASYICATSFDSCDTVTENYKEAKSNLVTLDKLGASIIHGVDATRMKLHPDLKVRKFDRIIFNFPHAGFLGREDDPQVIQMHRRLVEGFFANASGMLRLNGEVHVTHKTTAPFRDWNIEELARRHSLSLIHSVKFKKEDYPGYNNKKGSGLKRDDHFPLGECSTFKFGFYRPHKKSIVMSYGGFTDERPQPVQEIPIQVQNHEIPFSLRYPHTMSATGMNEFPARGKFNVGALSYSVHKYPTLDSFIHPQTSFTRNMTELPGYKRLPLMSDFQRETARFHNGCMNSSNGYHVPKSLIPCERYFAEVPGFQRENARSYDKTVLPGRTLNTYLYHMDENRCQSTLRSAQLPRMRTSNFQL